MKPKTRTNVKRKIGTRVTGKPKAKAADLVDMRGQLAAISKAQAVIEFTLEGKVLTANDNFLRALGYTLEEIEGQHHSLFVDPAYRQSAEYRMHIGQKNGEAARSLLAEHGIPIVSESLFGAGHRQVVFDIATGDVWVRQVRPVGLHGETPGGTV